MKLYEVKRHSKIKCVGDDTNTEYYFRKVDGMYAQIFKTKQDMMEFKNPSYVTVSADVEVLDD